MADMQTIREAELHGYEIFYRNFRVHFRSRMAPFYESQPFDTVDEAACAAVLKGYVDRPLTIAEALHVTEDIPDSVVHPPRSFARSRSPRWVPDPVVRLLARLFHW